MHGLWCMRVFVLVWPLFECKKSIEELVTYLRDGDFRLVRPSPSTSTAKRQQELFADGAIKVAVDALANSDLRRRAYGAELIHLLTTNNPHNRAAFGEAGVIPDLVSMISAASINAGNDEAILGAEEAGEALWILAYEGGSNHAKFAESHAADALADLILTSGVSPKSRMWAAAALGNFVAAYKSVDTESSEALRIRLIAKTGLLKQLVDMVRMGPSTHRDRSQWPSEALTSERFLENIVAWGAGQALKNLALSETSHAEIKRAGGVDALCALLESADWLEQLKARATLANLKIGCHKSGEEL